MACNVNFWNACEIEMRGLQTHGPIARSAYVVGSPCSSHAFTRVSSTINNRIYTHAAVNSWCFVL